MGGGGVSAAKTFKLIACFLLICAITGYTQQAEPHGAIVFIIALVVAALGFFAGEESF